MAQSGGSDERETGSGGSPLRWVAVAVALGIIGFFVMGEPSGEQPETAATASATAKGTATAPDAETEMPPRCRAAQASGGYRIGERSEGDRGGGGDQPVALPFSVEAGRAVATDRGFAVGIKRDREGATYNEVVVVDRRLDAGEVVELGRSRGDLAAPALATLGEGWVAAMQEPHASGLALRLVTPGADGLAWGAELEQGMDESLAVDMAFGSEAGVVVWDDVVEDGERAVVAVAVVDPGDLSVRGEPRVRSSDGVEAELPRVVAREGGFWLAYVARAPAEEGEDRTEGRYAAERIAPSWIELVPLDRRGDAQGVPRAVTPKEGHVLGYDLDVGRDGGALVAWRDDDTPSGAHGGTVSTRFVSAGAEGSVQRVTDENVGVGVPALVDGWLAVPDRKGRAQLAPLDREGTLLGALRHEPSLGRAQVLAARGERLLGAWQVGKAVELVAAECDHAAGHF